MSQIQLPISDHDAALPGDTLTSVTLNFEWRRTLVHLAEFLLDRRIYSGTEAEIDTVVQQAHALISDMYTVDSVLHMPEKLAARVQHDVFGLIDLPGLTTFIPTFADPALEEHQYDFGGFWNSGDPTKIIIPANKGGLYRFTAQVFFLAAPLGLRFFTIVHNSHDTVAQQRIYSDNTVSNSVSGDWECAVGDDIFLSISSTTDVQIVNSPAGGSIILSCYRIFR